MIAQVHFESINIYKPTAKNASQTAATDLTSDSNRSKQIDSPGDHTMKIYQAPSTEELTLGTAAYKARVQRVKGEVEPERLVAVSEALEMMKIPGPRCFCDFLCVFLGLKMFFCGFRMIYDLFGHFG